jgi:hypothetical protein
MTYQRLKITAHLKSNIILNDMMFLDGILYATKRKENQDYYIMPRFTGKKENLNIRLPIKKKCNAYLASRAYYRQIKEYVDFFRRRFLEVDASEWMKKKRVYLDQKTTKNWNKPICVKCLKDNKVWWYVVGDKEEIQKLLNNVHYIGKECNQGFGRVVKWEIEPTNKKGSRVFPSKTGKITCGFRPPYSNLKNKARCIIHRF